MREPGSFLKGPGRAFYFAVAACFDAIRWIAEKDRQEDGDECSEGCCGSSVGFLLWSSPSGHLEIASPRGLAYEGALVDRGLGDDQAHWSIGIAM